MNDTQKAIPITMSKQAADRISSLTAELEAVRKERDELNWLFRLFRWSECGSCGVEIDHEGFCEKCNERINGPYG